MDVRIRGSGEGWVGYDEVGLRLEGCWGRRRKIVECVWGGSGGGGRGY